MHDEEKLTQFYQLACTTELENDEAPIASDCVIAQNVQQMQDLWFLRENITVALKRRGYTHKCVSYRITTWLLVVYCPTKASVTPSSWFQV